jgi:hypothetical protein
MRTPLALVVTLLLPVLSAGTPPRGRQSPVELPARLKHAVQLTKQYDWATGQTQFDLGMVRVHGDESDGLYLQVSSRVEQGEKAPAVYLLSLVSVSRGKSQVSGRGLLVTADGRRQDFGKMKLARSDEVLGARRKFHAAAVPPEVMAWLAAVKKVEMSFGGVGFALSEDHLNALRDYLAYTRGQ